MVKEIHNVLQVLFGSPCPFFIIYPVDTRLQKSKLGKQVS